jgi:hypothetical protein
MHMSTLLAGFVLWLCGTVAIRLAGHKLLQLERPPRTIVLYTISLAVMALSAPPIFRALRIDGIEWPAAAIALMLPTLVLDAIGCVFFARLYPNLDPATAGLFGGWMLICCAGAAIGSLAGL